MPCDYKNYPPDWKERRARILARAGQVLENGRIIKAACCEFCGAENAAWGYRDAITKEFVCAPGWLAAKRNGGGFYVTSGYTKIVLTVAHLDHDPANNEVADERLKALCQKCHLDYDRPHHLKNAAETRRRKAGLVDLFKTPS